MKRPSRIDTQIHIRRSTRLPGYDYSQPGAYFITICTHEREQLFGNIVNELMHLNELGEMVNFTWLDLVNHIANILLGPFIIMPDHIHAIIHIIEAGEILPIKMAGLEPAPTIPLAPLGQNQTSLTEIVRQFKTFSARRINILRNTSGVPVWQRSFWDTIIRNDKSYRSITEYIVTNPQRWVV